MPWASVNTSLLLIVIVDRRIYCFHESEPDSLPPPVCFSPPKAPPISAPLVGILTFTIPQSDPLGPIHCKELEPPHHRAPKPINTENSSIALTLNTVDTSLVNRLEERPWFTLLLMAIASSTEVHLSTYTIGANVSSRTVSLVGDNPVIMVGSTKYPGRCIICA